MSLNKLYAKRILPHAYIHTTEFAFYQIQYVSIAQKEYHPKRIKYPFRLYNLLSILIIPLKNENINSFLIFSKIKSAPIEISALKTQTPIVVTQLNKPWY